MNDDYRLSRYLSVKSVSSVCLSDHTELHSDLTAVWLVTASDQQQDTIQIPASVNQHAEVINVRCQLVTPGVPEAPVSLDHWTMPEQLAAWVCSWRGDKDGKETARITSVAALFSICACGVVFRSWYWCELQYWSSTTVNIPWLGGLGHLYGSTAIDEWVSVCVCEWVNEKPCEALRGCSRSQEARAPSPPITPCIISTMTEGSVLLWRCLHQHGGLLLTMKTSSTKGEPNIEFENVSVIAGQKHQLQ